MKRTTISCMTMLLGLAFGCGGGTTMGMDMGKSCGTCSGGQTCNTTTGMCQNPAAPVLTGMQIDRMGRPGVNTALTNPFGFYKSGGNAQTSDMTKAAYNADNNPTGWLAAWGPPIKLSLGIFDALDDSCGNNLAYGALSQPNYTTLSQVLAGDALQVDTTKTTCTMYLGAEAAALGIANSDCGGRTLTENTIDFTYAVLVSGTNTVAGKAVTNGITAPAVAPLTSFPFLAAPM
jgi:hypothetical protein